MGTASKNFFPLPTLHVKEGGGAAGRDEGEKTACNFSSSVLCWRKKSDPSLSLIAGPAQTRSVAAFMYTTVDKTKEWSGVEGAKKGKRAF